MQWLHDPNQSNVDNLSNVRSEAIRRLRNENVEHLQAKIDELEINKKNIYLSETCIGASVTLRRVTSLVLK
jgi:hypothetical protein